MVHTVEIEGSDSPIFWQKMPVFYVDGVIGSARARGLERIVLGQVTYNGDPQATAPAVKPVCELIIAPDAIKSLIENLQDLLNQVSEDGQPA